MILTELTQLRLENHKLLLSNFEKLAEVVSYYGAVQAQDYSMSKWGLMQRMKNSSEENINNSFNKGEFIRTHIMRPTWHFVTPQDIRWILNLTSPRLRKTNGSYYRKVELTDEIFAKSINIFERALQGGKFLTRDELRNELNNAGIVTDNLRSTFLIMDAELAGIICSGPKIGKQFTYCLLEERVPKAKYLDREEALTELTKRYFTSHGPATIKDFTWWSGLTVNDAKLGIELNKTILVEEKIESKSYWLSPKSSKISDSKLSDHAYLLPVYDEYTIAYQNKAGIADYVNPKILFVGNGFWSSMILNGQIVGTWRRTLEKNNVNIYLAPSIQLEDNILEAFKVAANEYGKFLGLKVNLIINSLIN